MKSRTGFVANSSSTYFTITNKTKSPLQLIDFVRETVHMVIREYLQYEAGGVTPIDDEYADPEYIINSVGLVKPIFGERDEPLYSGKNEVKFDDWIEGYGYLYKGYLPQAGGTKHFKWVKTGDG